MPTRTDLANAIRALSMDAVQQANSGHPGAPMGMADIAEVLWNDFLKHNPSNPNWSNRDRFVLSNGHGSMLLYSLLHLTGYELTIEEIRNFRQLGSKTPGHPEYGYAPGVETTTGPLGQGLANAVGMALAEKVMAAQFNRGALNIVDHHTYVFLGDGCLMEGVSHEASSLAGTLGLGKLIALYDDNNISIDGEVDGWFTDNTPMRFESYGWHVLPDVDGHDPGAVKAAIEKAQAETGRPSLICCKTVIGKGSPNKQGTAATHGSALGVEEVAAVRETIGWQHEPFHVPEDVYAGWNAAESGTASEQAWNTLFADYQAEYPELAAEYSRRANGELPSDFEQRSAACVLAAQSAGENIASRKASQKALNALGPMLPEILGGSADLTGSNLTLWDLSSPISAEVAQGNYLYYGVREFGMAAIMNGIALHGGFINYGATFLMFMEYARNAVRMAALMKQQSIFVFTHDSIGLGEDGPTHQPVEQLTALRCTPNLHTWRPCDAVESMAAWRSALLRQDGPAALVFSRQTLAHQPRNDEQLEAIGKGGYVLRDSRGEPEVIIIATGSELGIAVEAAQQLGDKVRVVSMPCAELFAQQDESYRESVLPASVRKRVAVEAGHGDYWRKFVGLDGRVISIDRFGESAPGGELMKEFGFTSENVMSAVQQML
ncbi:MAG: transketolase [Pseudomonadota bacterium]